MVASVFGKIFKYYGANLEIFQSNLPEVHR
jgi:hypothetical protein